jgi:hypothetical protein
LKKGFQAKPVHELHHHLVQFKKKMKMWKENTKAFSFSYLFLKNNALEKIVKPCVFEIEVLGI